VSERLYTEEEVGQLQFAEAQTILKNLLRNLENVKVQRAASEKGTPNVRGRAFIRGQVDGLDVAIRAVKRRLR
jgi:hypothetical protein